jgi:hypothetical protein
MGNLTYRIFVRRLFFQPGFEMPLFGKPALAQAANAQAPITRFYPPLVEDAAPAEINRSRVC